MSNTKHTIIIEGVKLLKEDKNYKQSIIVKKLKALTYKTSEAALSKILKGKQPIGEDSLYNNAKGIQELLKMECCLEWDTKNGVYVKMPDCTPTEVPEWAGVKTSGVTFYEEGRMALEEKVQFFSTTQKEMIEFGLTLNSFTGYFFQRKEAEFKMPIYDLLKRGVHIKCYLLDPESNEARLYFNDREKFYTEAREGIGKIKTALANFKKILEDIELMSFAGKMEVYTYKHIPHQYMLALDKDLPAGKLHISHYLYGELRSNCPVIACYRKDNPVLYRRYTSSLSRLMKDAILVTDFDRYVR